MLVANQMATSIPGGPTAPTPTPGRGCTPVPGGPPGGNCPDEEPKATCDFDKDEGTTDTDVQLTFHATRSPTGDTVSHAVPYFIASMQDGVTVLNKQILAENFSFGPGESEVTFSASVPTTHIKLDNGKKPYDYSLLAGLQLTRQQMDFNAGRHTP